VRATVCGNVTLDAMGGSPVPGGSAYYAARALLALGAEVRVLTTAGEDFPPGALAGTDAVVAPAPRTTAFVNVHGPSGRTQRVLAVAPPLDPGRLPPAAQGADVLLLAPVLGETEPRAFVRAARAARVGLGVQGLVRAALADGAVVQPRWEFGTDALAGVDVAFVGEDDLRGQGDLLARLAAAVPIVVATHGRAGCEVLSRGERRRVGVFRVEEVDPTGAGDVFAAGFLFALASGAGAVDAARLGAAAASIVVEGIAGERLDRVGEAFERVKRVEVMG
jgi:sugar/nucleoside kinase (ribokinase family)